MALFTLSFDCPLFSQEASVDTNGPDVVDMLFTRFGRSIAETLAHVAPHASVILGDDSDDDE